MSTTKLPETPLTADELAALSPTKRRLYELLRERERARDAANAVPIPRRPAGEPVPLSFAQEQLWLLDRLEGGAAYNIPLVVRLEGELEVAALAAAFARLAARHESLRTHFEVVGGKPRQIVAPFLVPRLSQLDLSALASEERREVALTLARRDNLEPYDLARGPLLRTHLLRLAPREHVLVLNVHHIVSDVWSLSVLVAELGSFYWAEVSGTPVPVPELPIQFPDYAVWQRRELTGERLDELVAFWREELAGAPATVELVTDFPRPPAQSFEGHEVPLVIPGHRDALEALARAEGTTLFVVLLAVFDTLLLRYSGQADLPVGMPTAGRTRGELEGQIGFFVNSVVLRGRLHGDPSFRALVGRLKESVGAALRHEAMPFEKLVEALKPARDPSRSPLFQLMFALEKPPRLEVDLPGLSLRPMRIALGTSKFDLTLFTEEREDGLGGRLEYATRLFTRATAERFVGHFAALVAAVAADPDQRLSQLALLTPAEHAQLLASGSPDGSAPDGPPLPVWFERAVDAGPDRIALVAGEERLTYGALDAAANRLAHRLRVAGAGPEVLVGLAVEPSVATVVGLLGIAKAGAAYLPLDPAYPSERRAFMLEDAGVGLLVTDGLAPVLTVAGRELEVVHLDDPALASQPATRPAVALAPAHLAYVIYTSGSTGRPKGTLVSHANVTRLFTATAPWFGFGPADVWTLFHSYAFDFSVWELWGALAHGGRLVVVPWRVSRSPADFHRLLAAERVTVLNQTPSAFRLLAREDAAALPAELALAWVIFGGEALDPGELGAWFERHGDDRPRLVNMYGITETTVHVSFRPLGRADALPPASSVLGRAIPDLGLFVLERGVGATPATLAPVGVPGEIHVAGAGLARGYLGRPALTAERFVPNSFARTPGERLYRTGDLARLRPAGVGAELELDSLLELDYLGRIDQQVKLRGFRIELGEIEAALRRQPGVETAVVLLSTVAGDARLVAWVVPAVGASPEFSELAAALRQELPDYMVPAAWVSLAALPLTENGKLDRRALPAPEPVRRAAGRGDERGPASELERAVAEIWAEALGHEAIGLDDNFFDLGGHSMLLVEVHGRIAERLGGDLEVVDLFQYPTVRTLAARLGRAAGTPGAGQLASLERGKRRREGGHGNDIAIVTCALRVTGAATPEQFWQNLVAGVEGIERFAPEAALAAGVPAERLALPNYVLSEAPLEGIELFDAEFFGYSPREAETIDPQQRLYLELCWEALERAGLDPARFAGQIGVWASVAVSSYAQHNLQGYDPLGVMSNYFLRISLLTGNASDFLAQRISYHLGLDGPSVNVQTACSSAVVAVHMACEALRRGECDAALAGGTQVRVPQNMGYLYMEGGLPSPDGYCRPFDVASAGTVHGNGLGVVVLKRLEDALAAGDEILALIKGSAVNNDGAQRVGFTAPSVEGQTRVVSEALAASGVDPATIGFVEAHGTGTELGDSIEVSALTQAYRAYTPNKTYCALGSVKSNLGHLDTSGGLVSLVKAALALRHEAIPPTLNFTAPNPKLRLPESPFFVNAEAIPWPAGETPRRAGVNSFAIGGTNVHLVLEEAPRLPPSGPARPWQLLTISARTSTALHRASRQLAAWLEAEQPEARRLADAAFTLATGRKAFPLRRAVLCRDAGSALEAFAELAPPDVYSFAGDGRRRSVVHAVALGAGTAAERAALAAGLWQREPDFRAHVEALSALAGPPSDAGPTALAEALAGGDPEAWVGGRFATLLPLALGLALGRLWAGWGLEAEAVGAVDDAPVSGAAAAVLAGLATEEEAITGLLGLGPLPAGPAASELFVRPERAVLVLGVGTAGLELAPSRAFEQPVVASAASDEAADRAPLGALAQLWALGAEVAWERVWVHEERRRVTLPTYPFESRRHWIEPRGTPAAASAPAAKRSLAESLWEPSWQRRSATAGAALSGCWWLLEEGSPLGEALAEGLAERGAEVVRFAGPTFAGWAAGFADAARSAPAPTGVLVLWGLPGVPAEAVREGLATLGTVLADRGAAPAQLWVVAEAQEVSGEEALVPERAGLLELLPEGARAVDVTGQLGVGSLAPRLLAELGQAPAERAVALRGAYRWVERFEPLSVADGSGAARRVRVLEVGGGLGLAVARLLGADPGREVEVVAPGEPLGAVLPELLLVPLPLASLLGGGAGSGREAAVVARGGAREANLACRIVAIDEALLPAVGAAPAEERERLLARLLAPTAEPGWLVLSGVDPNLPAAARRQAAAPSAGLPNAGWGTEPGEERRRRSARPPLEVPHVAPATPLERELAAIWEELFGVDGLGLDDDFYQLGGHSLLAIRMVSQLRDRFGVDLLLREALAVATLRQLATVVAEKQLVAAGGVDLDALLAELEGMSDEQALALAGGEEGDRHG